MDVDAGQMDDSQNVRKEPTHNTRYVAKDLGRRGLNPLTEAERANHGQEGLLPLPQAWPYEPGLL